MTKKQWEYASFFMVFGLCAISSFLLNSWVCVPIVIANVWGYAEGRLKPTTRPGGETP